MAAWEHMSAAAGFIEVVEPGFILDAIVTPETRFLPIVSQCSNANAGENATGSQ